MSLIRKHVAVLQAWACLDLVDVNVGWSSKWVSWYLRFKMTAWIMRELLGSKFRRFHWQGTSLIQRL